MLRIRFVSALLVAIVCCAPAIGQDASEKKKDEKKEQKKESSPYDVPANASAAELGRFLESLRTKRPRGREAIAKRLQAIYESSSAILDGKAGEAKEELRVIAADAKLGVLQAMRRASEDFEGPTQNEFAELLKKDSSPKVALIGKHFFLTLDARGMMKLKSAERQGLIEEAFLMAKTHGIDSKTFTLLNSGIARTLERAGKTKDAIKVLERLSPMMAASSNPRLVAYQPKVEGAVRRLKLPGNPIELKGTVQTGKPFEMSKYAGKVVLVDFWATWCRPCIAELPNMQRNYDEYHSQGFEIVGVNMDSNQERFRKFIEDRELPWEHITGTEKDFGWNHPIAAHYGISAIPTQMLIGRDGKVIALNLRGKALDRKLEELFGAAADSEEEKAAAK